MKRPTIRLSSLTLGIFAAAFVGCSAASAAETPFAGRWDITVTTANATYPDWMEVLVEGSTPRVRVQQRTGSVRPVADARMEGAHLLLTVVKTPEVAWDVVASDGKIAGTIRRAGEIAGHFTGVPAPALKRAEPTSWSAPEPLFNGKDLAGWVPDHPEKSHWLAKDGVLLNQTAGANLKTERKFEDFRLHVEFNCPDRGNSGIYLRGRYEVQVEYEAPGTEDALHSMGAVYGMVAPSKQLPGKAGEWETMDITLVGRYVTIVRNGVTTVDRQEIAGITGGALDPNEADPGPFYLQGDHTGGMKFRNITVSVPHR